MIFDQIENHFVEDPDELIEEVSNSQGLYVYEQHYFQRYQNWKRKMYEDQIYNFSTLTVDRSCLVCAACWNNKLFAIGKLKDFNWKVSVLANFSKKCIRREGHLYCPDKHQLGKLMENKDDVIINRNRVKVYCPFEKIVD